MYDVGGIHKECAENRKTEWQKNNKNTVIKQGDNVQLKFTEEGVEKVEHMWVTVTEINGKSIKGNLCNDPIYITKIKDGDEVNFNFNQIEQVYGQKMES